MGGDEPAPHARLESLLEDHADLFENAPCGYLSTLPDGEIVKANGTLLEWTGFERELIVGRRFQSLLAPGSRIYHDTHYAPLLLMQGSVREIALEIVCADGRRLAVLVNAVLHTEDDGRPMLIRTTVFDATQRREYERELLRARDRERIARRQTERLYRLSTALAGAIDARQVAAAAAADLADALGADHIALAVVAPSEQLQIIGSDGSPPDAGDCERLSGASGAALRSAMRAASNVFAPANGDDDQLADVHAPGTGFAALPLTVRGVAIGVAIADFAAAHEFDDDERAYASTWALQTGQALERARLYESERSIARTLQRSLLAGDPPRDRRFAVASHYQPAIATLDVGGDWHDTFCVGDDVVGVIVGDVVGRGITAASTMGQLRSATRALACAELGPANVLTHLSSFVAQAPSARLATLVYAELDLATGRLRYVCAGHPPPVLMKPSEQPTLLWDGRSAPLGIEPVGGARREGQAVLPPGARLLLYTDGLVERRGEIIDTGLQRLVDTLDTDRTTAIDELPCALVRALVNEDDARDDVCVLCLQRRADTMAVSALPATIGAMTTVTAESPRRRP